MKKISKQAPGTLIVVEWVDAESMDEWADLSERLEDQAELPRIISVGFVLRHTDEALTIARSYHAEQQHVEGTFNIPHGTIKDIKKLRYGPLNIAS